ncbi:hypothetical protein F5Y19DRAFT_433366 [Xylariaceae sp. FL1651]|nr:hypothetical protein F5Y19DRAFT_433366 [Xylariaceae sp. FL1651]
MRFSLLVTALSVNLAAATPIAISGDSPSPLTVRDLCFCDEVHCDGPACCANG